jgi:hypothetical protein
MRKMRKRKRKSMWGMEKSKKKTYGEKTKKTKNKKKKNACGRFCTTTTLPS